MIEKKNLLFKKIIFFEKNKSFNYLIFFYKSNSIFVKKNLLNDNIWKWPLLDIFFDYKYYNDYF